MGGNRTLAGVYFTEVKNSGKNTTTKKDDLFGLLMDGEVKMQGAIVCKMHAVAMELMIAFACDLCALAEVCVFMLSRVCVLACACACFHLLFNNAHQS